MWNPFSRQTAPVPAPTPAPPVTDDHDPVAAAAPRALDVGDGAVAAPAPEIAEVEHMGQVAVATLTVTELTQETGAEELSSLLDELAQTGALHFVLDMQNVQYMDTACLGCLVAALNDLIEPSSSIDHSIPRFTWWSRRGTREWVQYDLPVPTRVSGVSVYWFDDTGTGRCRLPASRPSSRSRSPRPGAS